MVRLTEFKSDELLNATVLEDAGPDGPTYLDLSPSHWKHSNTPWIELARKSSQLDFIVK